MRTAIIMALGVWALIALCMGFASSAFGDDLVIDNGVPKRGVGCSYINVSYSNAIGQVFSQPFCTPNIIRDIGKNITYISNSPLDPTRSLDALPTYGLARFHWWLIGNVILSHYQRVFSDCIGGYNELADLLGLLRYDHPNSPYFTDVISSRDYQVPFDALQRADGNVWIPPSKEDAIAHAKAGVFNVNDVVFKTGQCLYRKNQLRGQVLSRFR